MTLAQLQYFQALAHILHYTRTAEELHIAQPSLSYSINELEKELGVKLFNKEDRKITLTMYGEQFLPYVESALATINDGTEALRQMSGSAMQIIRLGYFHSISASLIPALMKDLYEQTENERLRFQFSEGSSFDLLGLLKKGDLDVQLLGRGFAWLDTGTMDSLVEAADFVRMIEKRQGIKISAPEEIAFKYGWIDRDTLLESAERYGKSPYGQHLKNVADGKLRY